MELSLNRGRAGMVGQGKNIWPNVHITEGRLLILFNERAHYFVLKKSRTFIYCSVIWSFR
jgi:hypothetical protein